MPLLMELKWNQFKYLISDIQEIVGISCKFCELHIKSNNDTSDGSENSLEI